MKKINFIFQALFLLLLFYLGMVTLPTLQHEILPKSIAQTEHLVAIAITANNTVSTTALKNYATTLQTQILQKIPTVSIEIQGIQENSKVLFNLWQAVILNISQQENKDNLKTYYAVKDFVTQMKMPKGIQLNLTNDHVAIVEYQQQSLFKNSIQSVILIILVLWLFFNFRFALWSATSIFAAFSGTLFFISLLGYSLNLLTVTTLLIATVLIINNTLTQHENTKQARTGILFSFITTVIIFIPFLFLTEKISEIFQQVIIVLCVTLFIHLVIILFNQIATTSKQAQNKLQKHLNHIFTNLQQRIIKINHQMATKHYSVIGASVLFFLISIAMLFTHTLHFQLFPIINGDVIEAHIVMQKNTSFEEAEKIVMQIENRLGKINYDLKQEFNSEDCLVKNVQTRFTNNTATITVDLLPANQRRLTIDTALRRWRNDMDNIEGIVSINYDTPQVNLNTLPIDITLQGQDAINLKKAALDLQYWLQNQRGVVDLSIIYAQKIVKLQGKVDNEIAHASNIISKMQQRFLPKLQDRYSDVNIEVKGIVKTNQLITQLILFSMLSLSVLFILLYFQFQNYLHALVVTSLIPLSFTGVIWGHLIMGIHLSVLSLMGFFALVGIIINQIYQYHTTKINHFRILSLTFLVTLAALLPFLLENHLAISALLPVVVSIIFGLLFAVLCLLFIMPILKVDNSK